MIFYIDQQKTDRISLANSAHQVCRIVTLLQQFVKRVCDKNLHRNRQRKSQEQSYPTCVCRCIGTHMMEMIETTPNPPSNAVNSQDLIRKQRKGFCERDHIQMCRWSAHLSVISLEERWDDEQTKNNLDKTRFLLELFRNS